MFAKASALTLALAGLSAAIHPLVGSTPSGNPTIHPEVLEIVPACKEYTVTWTPTSGNSLSIQLLRGPATNAVPIATLTESTENTGSFKWTPSSSLEADTERYGLLLVDETTGLYQYTPQFGISKDASCSVSSSSASASASASAIASASASASAIASASASANGIASTGGYGYGATSASASATVVASPSSSNATIQTSAPIGTITAVPVVIGTGTGSIISAIVTPTIPMSVPETLKTSASSAPSSTTSSPPLFTGAAGQVRAGFGFVAAFGALAFML